MITVTDVVDKLRKLYDFALPSEKPILKEAIDALVELKVQNVALTGENLILRSENNQLKKPVLGMYGLLYGLV